MLADLVGRRKVIVPAVWLLGLAYLLAARPGSLGHWYEIWPTLDERKTFDQVFAAIGLTPKQSKGRQR